MKNQVPSQDPDRRIVPNTLLAGFDKNVSTYDSIGFDDFIVSGGMGRKARPASAGPDAALLDIYTPSQPAKPKYNVVVSPSLSVHRRYKFDCVRRSENSRWNRATLGMMMPGITWFLTLTTSPQSKRPVKDDWILFWRKWWKPTFPGVENMWIETDEGLGVIHSLVRLPGLVTEKGDSRCRFPTQPVIQNAWAVRHDAFSTWSKVSHAGKMANYARQKQKELAAGEMKKQSNVLSWDYSRGWLPAGFLKAWGPVWRDTIIHIPRVEQSRVIADWLLAVVLNPENLKIPPVYENNKILEYYV